MQDTTPVPGGPTRRSFLRRASGLTVHHTASVLVQARPAEMASIQSALGGADGIESHGTGDTGKLILTIEAASDRRLMDAMDRIQATPGVINVALVYHHMDEDGDDD